MSKRGPKRIDTETLAKRGSSLGKARQKAERKAATARAAFNASGVWDVQAEVDVSDLNNVTVTLFSDLMLTDLTVKFTNNAADKKVIRKAFGISA